MSDQNRVGSLITRYRERAKLTKAELARRSGVSAPYLTQIEAGDRQPSKQILMRLAGAFGIKNYELLEAAGLRFDSGAYFQNIDRAVGELRDRLEGDDLMYFEGIIEELPELAQWTVSGPAAPAGADGWDELDADDQRLVQQLINRLGTKDTEG